jgi:hypothetical protein
MDSSVDESDNNKIKRFQVKRSDASADVTETLPEGRSRKLERKLTSVENLTQKNYLPQILEHQDANSRKSSFSDKEGSVHSYLGLVTSTQDARQDATEMPGGCLPDWYARKESNESEFSRKESNESTRSRRSGAYAMDPSKLVVKIA